MTCERVSLALAKLQRLAMQCNRVSSKQNLAFLMLQHTDTLTSQNWRMQLRLHVLHVQL